MNALKKVKEWLKVGNRSLWVATAAMIAIGTIAICLVTPYVATTIGFSENSLILIYKYIPYLVLGVLMLIGCSRASKKFMLVFSYILCSIGCLFILMTMISPDIVAGTARYVYLFSTINVDPFMLTLPAYIVLMSHWLSTEHPRNKKIWIWLCCSLLTLFIVMAAFNAPYMSMVATYAMVFFMMSWVSRKNMPMVFYTSIVLGLGMLVMFGYSVATIPHVYTRLASMMYGTSYAVQSAHNAIHSSGLFGSTPESLHALTYLPDMANSFMFASIICKMGTVPGFLIFALYTWTSCLILERIQAASLFNKLFAVGVLIVFVLGYFGNMSTSIGGIQYDSYLPFMSYACTNLLLYCIMFGFLLSNPEKK